MAALDPGERLEGRAARVVAGLGDGAPLARTAAHGFDDLRDEEKEDDSFFIQTVTKVAEIATGECDTDDKDG